MFKSFNHSEKYTKIIDTEWEIEIFNNKSPLENVFEEYKKRKLNVIKNIALFNLYLIQTRSRTKSWKNMEDLCRQQNVFMNKIYPNYKELYGNDVEKAIIKYMSLL